MRPSFIALRYLKFWLWLDVLILAVDWTLLMMEGFQAGSAARLGRSLRILRFVRTLRLMRAMKLKRLVQLVQDHISTEAVSIWFGIIKVVLLLLIANHILACGWYYIGLFESDHGVGWVKARDMANLPILYRYVTALHWSLAQFTPAPNEIFPRNVYERSYAVFVLVTALVVFSAFVSTVTAGMVQLRDLQSAESRQFWILRRYLRDWTVRGGFQKRILRYLEYAYTQQRKRVQEKDVPLLQLLSEPLREELRHETLRTHLIGHPLFLRCRQRTSVLSRALSSRDFGQGDLVFECGETASKMVLCSTGILHYFLGVIEDEGESEDMPNFSEPPAANSSEPPAEIAAAETISISSKADYQTILNNDWVAEPVLWTSWICLGDLQATMECQVITIDADTFSHEVRINKPLWLRVRQYARTFVMRLNACPRENLTDVVSDLFSPDSLLTGDVWMTQNTMDFDEHEPEALLAKFISRMLKMFGRSRRRGDTIGTMHSASEESL